MKAQSTLSAEHAQLLSQVTERVDDVLDVTACDRWPGRELNALAGYLRAELIRQVSDEERLLFPAHEAVPELSRLARDHARLRACVDVVTGTARGDGPRSPARVAVIVRDLLTQLDRHFTAEEAALAGTGRPASSTTSLGGHAHRWYSLTEGPVIDLDALPVDRMIDAVRDRLYRLRHGERLDLCSRRDPELLCRRLAATERDYGFAYLAAGPDRWRVRVTYRLEK
ncbi:hemerythrin domain-containing protein [Nonomuraea sp. NPDC048916]|uniref:hemerythrin domain-containing protein n=1 Tax=Nonomuraea sp. NPDC048916 TaxID=3154232 RepID=UPI0033C0A89C